MYKVFEEPFSEDFRFTVRRYIGCVNGVSAWFTVCHIAETSPEEMGFSDGLHGTARERADTICEALNR